jgi:hypothetical protein
MSCKGEWDVPACRFSPRVLTQGVSSVDRLEGELMSELENGRLVRLLCKFGFINERPEWVSGSFSCFWRSER